MKPTLLQFLAIGFIFLLGFNCTKKVSPGINIQKKEKPIKNIPVKEKVVKDFSFLFDTENTSPTHDSLYVLQDEIDIHPDMIFHRPFDKIIWNDLAQVFISIRPLSIFNKNLDLLSTNKQVIPEKVFSYNKLPLGAGVYEKTLFFFDVKTMKLTKEYFLESPVLRFHELPENHLMVVASSHRENQSYIYTFKEDVLIETDSIQVASPSKLHAIHPSQNFILTRNSEEFEVRTLPDQKVINKIKDDNKNSGLFFSKDGKRLIIVQGGNKHNKKITTQKIFSFPELQEIGTYTMGYNVKYTLKDKLILFGDRSGKLLFIDILSGKIIYSNKESQRIYSLGIVNENDLLIGTSQKNKLRLTYRNITTNQDEKSILSSTKWITPIAFSPDSKVFYFSDKSNDLLSKINLETQEISAITKLPKASKGSINADGTMMASFNGRYLLNLENGNVESLPDIHHCFFGGNANELICRGKSNSIKIINAKTKKQSQPTNCSMPKAKPSNRPNSDYAVRNPLNKDELIYFSESPKENEILHFNELTYECRNSMTISKKRRTDPLDFLGVDKNGAYYIANEKMVYCYDATSHAVIDSIAGQFSKFDSYIAAAPNRDAFLTKKNHRAFIFSPHSSDTYQRVDMGGFNYFSPNLEYFIHTSGDLIKIYKWKGE